MTQSDLCPVCARPLEDHHRGSPCCYMCGETDWMLVATVDGIGICSVCCKCGAIMRNEDMANTRVHPSPWLNAPIPEEGETQTLEVYSDPLGKWAIRPWSGSGNSFSIAKGYYGGTPRTESRTMINGKLVYEEEK